MKKFLAPLFLAAWFAVFSSRLRQRQHHHGRICRLSSRASPGPATARPSLSWRVVNPNIVPYLVAQSSHKVQLNGVVVGTDE
jgi:hypothetical protein